MTKAGRTALPQLMAWCVETANAFTKLREIYSHPSYSLCQEFVQLSDSYSVASTALDEWLEKPLVVNSCNFIARSTPLYPKFHFRPSSSPALLQCLENSRAAFGIVISGVPVQSSQENVFQHWWHDAAGVKDWDTVKALLPVASAWEWSSGLKVLAQQLCESGKTDLVYELARQGLSIMT